MAKYYTLRAIENSLGSHLVEGVKVTKVTPLEFNNMEGWNFDFNLVIKTIQGYKDKRVKIRTNSTYLDFMDWETVEQLKEGLQEHLESYLGIWQ